ncbi:MAG: septum formation initiator family protein, partial [Pseudomonadota bacterium]
VTSQLDQLEQQHQTLFNRVSLLKPESLDLDMLEQVARLQLGLVRKGEFVEVFKTQHDSKF